MFIKYSKHNNLNLKIILPNYYKQGKLFNKMPIEKILVQIKHLFI